MSIFRPLSVIALACGLVLSGSAMADAASEAEGLRIATARKDVNRGWVNTVATITMTLRNAQGQEAVREMRVKTLEVPTDGDKALTIFDSPRDLSGTAFLSFSHIDAPDEQWIFLPAIKRVKRISTSNKSGPFLGSEYAFEDMTSFEVPKFTYDLLGEREYQGDAVYLLEQIPLDEFSGYSKQIVWIDKAHYRPRKVEFFDRKGAPLKVLEFDNYQLFDDEFWRPMRSFMYNLQTQKSTELITHSLVFGTELEESDFDSNSLRRAR
ncbi:outer membrane lipoprotein-sorting protein [Aestuariibacter sp. A3R04]|uniref:outer membrane lipoprotein-sorting protein n=1 Tax=Aestuariibacter sp. A3R04 TaxID=2841571 RepID=UPI001C07F8D4|nr:outer membrane lipoprotein-sorting protein [Aestuariibacter sp. A3R04]MBU3021728.1 outer membrane lipoprotein-sorting protein [Aestuariibacter sp. A3R04]